MPRVVHCEQEVRGLGEDQSCYLDYAVYKLTIGSKYVTYTCGVFMMLLCWEVGGNIHTFLLSTACRLTP